ncbi:MAG TPA: AMP-binding protein [Streptosporangiaceae bacterium]|nr:AMP-binding protein [Streptosporangiaceae bacterium]
MSDRYTVPEFLIRAASRWPDQEWVRTPDGPASRAAVLDRARHLAGGLREAGVKPGDRVVLAAPNSIGFLVGWFGAMFARAPVLAVNPRAAAAELAAVTAALEPRLVVTADDIAALEQAAPADPLPADPEEHVAYLQTSGSTGTPKFIIRTHLMYTLAAEAFPWWLGLVDRDVMLTTLPLAHGNAQLYSVLGSLGLGAQLALLPGFSATTFWDDVAAYRATQFNAVGAMLEILMQRPPSDAERAHRVRLCYTAPAPGRQRHLAIEERFGLHLVLGYSQSEAGGFGLIMPLQGAPRFGSMGRPRQHPRLGTVTAARIVDADAHELGEDTVGELEIRNPTATPGYLGRPEESAALLRDGWLRTGDLAWRDADGFYYFGGRVKELIRHKGENLSPAEVERVLEEHPAVAVAAVIGVPSDLSEEDVKGFVVLESGSTATAADLFAWSAERLPPYKCPRYLEIVTDLPLTENQKVAKTQLPRQRTATETDRG